MGVGHKLPGDPLESLREHARLMKTQEETYLKPAEFLNQHTDGAGNALARVYSRREARELFKDFSEVSLKTYFLNKRWLPVVGKVLPRSLEARLASRWVLHLWLFATK